MCLNNFVESNTANLLFTKALDWQAENEFRIVIREYSNDGPNKEYMHLKIGDSICGIVMGCHILGFERI